MKIKKVLMSTVIAAVVSSSILSSMSVSAYSQNNTFDNQIEDIEVTNKSGYTFSVESGDLFEEAILLSEETKQISEFKTETVRTFKMPDGTICSDSLIVEQVNTGVNSLSRASTSGSANNVTYTTDVGMAKVSIIASFDWYESGAWSYVRCSNMTAYYTAKTTQIGCGNFSKSKSNGYIKSGNAWAKVAYNFYNKYVPGSGKSGTFKVTCSDTGSISS